MHNDEARTVMSSRVERTLARLGAIGIEHALLSDVGSVCYLTGYDPPIEIGRTPFEGGPAMVYLAPARTPVALVPDMEAEAAEAKCIGCEVEVYTSYTYRHPLKPDAYLQEATLDVVGSGGGPPSRIGIEGHSLPTHLSVALRQAFPGVALHDVSAELAEVRVVKDSLDLERLALALHLCDVGQLACKELAEPGMTEIELFSAIRGQMEAAAGERIPILADLCSGPRSAEAGGPPTDRVLAEGDWIQCDLVPRRLGYWADSCNGVVVGEPTAQQREWQSIAAEALQLGMDAVKPGMRAGDLDRLIRGHLSRQGYDYPHHSGHGLGVTFHEEPRIVPGADTVLQPNMVLALEPAVYVPGLGGVRLEHVFRVTAGGAELLSKYPHVM
jgi:Xaa-Pro aminopeptidase